MKHLATFLLSSAMFFALSSFGLAKSVEKRTIETKEHPVMEKSTAHIAVVAGYEISNKVIFVMVDEAAQLKDLILILKAEPNSIVHPLDIYGQYESEHSYTLLADVNLKYDVPQLECKDVYLNFQFTNPIIYTRPVNQPNQDNRQLGYSQMWRSFNLVNTLKI